MRMRIVSGVVVAFVALTAIFLGGVVYALGVIALTVRALHEFHGIAAPLMAGHPVPLWDRARLAATTLLLATLAFVPDGRAFAVASIVAFLASLAVLVVAPSGLTVPRWALGVSEVLYIGGLGAALLVLRGGVGAAAAGDVQGRAWVLVVCAVTWGSDTSAYFVGRALGRRPFFPRISPKKTVEGAIGGIVGGVLSALVVAVLADWQQPLPIAALVALTCAVAAQTGDLVESALKRQAGVKDSGTLIPGHGGVLDRIDGLLFVAGVAYCWHLLTV